VPKWAGSNDGNRALPQQSVPLGVASTEDSGEYAPDSAAQKNVHISLDDLGQPDSHAGANTCERFKERIGSR
jgi:hypothetical protein